MRDHRSLFSLEQMARTVGVSRSGYYNFIKRPASARELENQKLIKKIKAILKKVMKLMEIQGFMQSFRKRGYSVQEEELLA